MLPIYSNGFPLDCNTLSPTTFRQPAPACPACSHPFRRRGCKDQKLPQISAAPQKWDLRIQKKLKIQKKLSLLKGIVKWYTNGNKIMATGTTELNLALIFFTFCNTLVCYIASLLVTRRLSFSQKAKNCLRSTPQKWNKKKEWKIATDRNASREMRLISESQPVSTESCIQSVLWNQSKAAGVFHRRHNQDYIRNSSTLERK